uniref:Outer dense fiber protein 2 n=1 Tax=Cyprinodon variegatus TaxID=28743 RepID=A0A3Q2CL95_CYPVA
MAASSQSLMAALLPQSKAMKNRSGSPPVHVHVSDGKVNVENSRLRPTAKVQTRVPWIPPGKASYKWEGPTQSLEITPPLPEPEPERSQSVLHVSDLTSEEEEVLQGRISHYERKIESLMSEVSSLRTEVGSTDAPIRILLTCLLSPAAGLPEEHVCDLILIQMLMKSINDASFIKDYLFLLLQLQRRVFEFSLLGSGVSRVDGSPQDPDVLLRKLMDAEAAASAAAQQVSALKQSKLSSSGLAHQKDLLLKKLETFEATNRTLRQLLREQRESQSIGLSEQKEVLLKRLADTEAEKAVNAKSSADLSRTLESTRAHLQGQLRSKEAENNRLSVQIKNLERAANQQRAEMDHVTEQLNRLKQEALEDREALKRATKAQKHRAARSEDAAGQLSVQLLQMVDEALAAAEVWQRRHAEEAKEKGQLEMELSLLNSRISELSEQLQSVQERGRSEREALLDRLHGVTAENAAAKLENQNLKASASAAEEKLSLSQSELQQVKATIRQYEALLDSYKIQVLEVAQAEREAQSVKEELEKEIEEVRRELLGRLSDLEALPESLRRCQLQLQDAQDQERLLERRNVELSTNLTELRLKVSRWICGANPSVSAGSRS